MIEVEVKARAPADLLKRLSECKAVPGAVERHRDIYFRSPVRDFKATDEALRIRIKDSGAYLTYKGPRLDSSTKTRQEVTVPVADAEALEEILTSLGFVRFAEVIKTRRKYLLDEATVAVDQVEGLGSFVEVEMGVSADWGSARDRVLGILGNLGAEECIRKSYLEMLLERV